MQQDELERGKMPGDSASPEHEPDSLDYLETRLERVFARRAVLPRHALQYRLCEVGRHRLDPRELTRSVQALVDSGRGAREVVPGIYVDPELDENDAGYRADGALGVVRRMAASVNGGVLGGLADAAASTVAITGEAGGHLAGVAPTYLAADVVLPRPSTLLKAGGGPASRILLWVTHELPWLYPDDPRLWGALRAAHLDGAHLAVFARKIAPAMFALFKALGVRGTQYYAMLVDEGAREALTDAAESVGWAPVRQPADLHGSPALQQLGASVAALAAGNARVARAADVEQTVESAIARGFDTPGAATPEALLTWADDAGLAMPAAWREGVIRWERGPAAAPRARAMTPGSRTSRDDPNAEAVIPGSDQNFEGAGGPRTKEGQTTESASEPTVNRIRVAAEVSREEWVRLTTGRRGTD